MDGLDIKVYLINLFVDFYIKIIPILAKLIQ